MAGDLSFNPPVVRRDVHFSGRGLIAGLMRGVGYAIFATAVGTLLVVTVADGLRGLAFGLILLGTALIPWLINGVVLVSWGGALFRGEAIPRLPRTLALLIYSWVNTLILFQIDNYAPTIEDFSDVLGLLGPTLLAAAAIANLLGGIGIAVTRPAPDAPKTGVAHRAWILVVVTAAILAWAVAMNWNQIEFLPSSGR